MSNNKKFIIQKIDIEDVIKHDKNVFNSNNHWEKDNDGNLIAPKNYKEVIEKSNAKYWIDKFRTEYIKITIDDPHELKWMIDASKISSKTGKFTNLYRDELNSFVKKYKDKYSNIFNGTGYFVRSENVSFKYGQHKIGPYYSLEQIIESAISCIDGHKPLYEDTKILTLYLLEWINIYPFNEFRVFVHNKKITAISQQDLYSVFEELDGGYESNQENITKLRLIEQYFEGNIKNEINHVDSYVYDFAILNNNIPYFIEISSFGKEYAAGSALFHWIIDEDILYGENDSLIYFRYTVRNNFDTQDNIKKLKI